MSRSLKKGPYVDMRLMGKVEKQQRAGDRRPIRTWSRDCTIVPEFVGQYFEIHNGKNFFKVLMTEEDGRDSVLLGHRPGPPGRTSGHTPGRTHDPASGRTPGPGDHAPGRDRPADE